MYPRGYDEDWGMGVYYIPDGLTIDLFQDTLGSKIGTVTKSGELNIINSEQIKLEYEWKDIEWVGNYYNILLKVKKCPSRRYLQVFWKTKPSGYYVLLSDLLKEQAKFYLYKDILFDTSISLNDRRIFEWSNIGVNLYNHCLNLRDGPNTESNLIECLYGNKLVNEGITHMKILDHEGLWAKVEVTTMIYDIDDDDCPSKLKTKRSGWLKAIDNSGFPNIWYSVSSY